MFEDIAGGGGVFKIILLQITGCMVDAIYLDSNKVGMLVGIVLITLIM